MNFPRSNLWDSRRFLPLFKIQFLNALSDQVLRNSIIVMISYQGLAIAGLTKDVSVSLVAVVFLLPFFLFSAYAGELADSMSKVALIRLIKLAEILIVGLTAWGMVQQNINILLSALILMGIHSTFFGPIKFSLLPHYLQDRKSLLIANGCVELGTFIAVLLGQTLGSWFTAKHQLGVVLGILVASNGWGLWLSYRLSEVTTSTSRESARPRFRYNVVAATWQAWQKINANQVTRNNIHAISWFWALGVIYGTQLVIFTKSYMGGGPHVFSILMALFSVSIGVGSLVSSLLAGGIINRRFVILGAVGISGFTFILLLVNSQPQASYVNLTAFSTSMRGMLNYGLIFAIGFCAGLYSITCYNELQVTSPLTILSQVIAVNNILNALYMVLASITATIILLFANVWQLFLLLIVVNLGFVAWYYRINRNQLVLDNAITHHR